jgi:hypothetical protein
MDELVAQKESEINAAYDERMRNYEERYVPRYLSEVTFCSWMVADWGAGNKT